MTSFSYLFSDCKSIESINFKKFYRNNIIDMHGMFYKCLSLKELNLNNFNTDNVTYIYRIFERCLSLKELNLDNLNTHHVITDKYDMFSGCSDEIKLKIKSKYKNFQ